MQREPKTRFACTGCMEVFNDDNRRDCCLNCESSGVTLSKDEAEAAQRICPRRKAYLEKLAKQKAA